eukprot:719713-Prymnesium_polylepis.2
MAVSEQAFWAMHGKPAVIDQMMRTQISEQLVCCRKVSSLASAQRGQTVRCKFKASGYYNPTILFVDATLDASDANRLLSVTEALVRLASRQARTQPVAVAVQIQTNDRGRYLFLPGDLVFVLAGEIEDSVMARRARFELWWAIMY